MGGLTIGNFSPPRMGTPKLTEFRELRLGCDQVLASEEDTGTRQIGFVLSEDKFDGFISKQMYVGHWGR